MKKYLIFLFIACSVLVAVFWYTPSPIRKIASSFDSDSQSLTSVQNLKRKILIATKVARSADFISAQIGAPSLENNNFLCTDYPTMDLVFRVDGVVISGEIPALVVRSYCEMDVENQHSQVIGFSLREALRDSETFTTAEAKIYKLNWFQGLESEPWKLSEIHLHHKNLNEVLKISPYDILSVWPRGLPAK